MFDISPCPRDERSVASRVAALNARYHARDAAAVLRGALDALGRVALVSSFGAESVVLLHMAARIDRDVAVLFIDTGMLFAETLAYQRRVADQLGLRNVTRLRAPDIGAGDGDVPLHRRDPEACCALRKVNPLSRALAGFDGWISGRKRFQSGTRAGLAHFEPDPGSSRIRINPLALWSRDDIADYMRRHQLPAHPLVARGFASIGCRPCTTAVKPHEDPRAGRWRGSEKTECGIHFPTQGGAT